MSGSKHTYLAPGCRTWWLRGVPEPEFGTVKGEERIFGTTCRDGMSVGNADQTRVDSESNFIGGHRCAVSWNRKERKRRCPIFVDFGGIICVVSIATFTFAYTVTYASSQHNCCRRIGFKTQNIVFRHCCAIDEWRHFIWKNNKTFAEDIIKLQSGLNTGGFCCSHFESANIAHKELQIEGGYGELESVQDC